MRGALDVVVLRDAARTLCLHMYDTCEREEQVGH